MSQVYHKTRFGNLRIFDVSTRFNTKVMRQYMVRNKEVDYYRVSSLQHSKILKNNQTTNVSLIEDLNSVLYTTSNPSHIDIATYDMMSFINSNVTSKFDDSVNIKVVSNIYSTYTYEYIQEKQNVCILNMDSRNMRTIFRIKSGNYGLSVALSPGQMLMFNNNQTIDKCYMHYYPEVLAKKHEAFSYIKHFYF